MPNQDTANPITSIQAADKIIRFVRENFPETKECSRMDALWLAFQGLHCPAAAAGMLERYRVITPSS